ncbi:hypothetical protein [Acinetobacter gerneri]|uniref:hypothetical protein n=1 Tax=Acinetobacter gerneri TaxID=202952 RepID=UPI0023F38DE1|nr:hypothetical protein [Acinetobacter gerneri]MCH4245745.1 hypothetical protein [Acinetobacter gerneri]
MSFIFGIISREKGACYEKIIQIICLFCILLYMQIAVFTTVKLQLLLLIKNKAFIVYKREVGGATSVSAVAGAVSPWTASTILGAVATSNTLQYGINQILSGSDITTKGLIFNAKIGAVGGGIGGTVVSKLSLPVVTNSIFISRSLAQRVNNNQVFYANVQN